MYELTEVYKVHDGPITQTLKRPILVNPAQITFVREHVGYRRVFFSTGTSAGMDQTIDVEESMEHIRAWVK